MQRSGDATPRAALVVDAREGTFLEPFPEILRGMRAQGVPVSLLFFESTDETLKRRFSETRRPHPMLASGGTLEAAIQAERAALAHLREVADRIIDTSRFTAHELRAFSGFVRRRSRPVRRAQRPSGLVRIQVRRAGGGRPRLRRAVHPESVLRGRPSAARRPAPRRSHVRRRQSESSEFMTRLKDMLDHLLPLYARRARAT